MWNPLGSSELDWPEDFSHENGNYMCQCCHCDQVFFGHKRRVSCKVCSDKSIRWPYQLRFGDTPETIHVDYTNGDSEEVPSSEMPKYIQLIQVYYDWMKEKFG